jgi:hypothetical protein
MSEYAELKARLRPQNEDRQYVREAKTVLQTDAVANHIEALEGKLAECLERNALLEARLGKTVEALADVYRLHMRRGPAWDHEPTKKVMVRAAAALAAFKGDEA